jgi:hypothetical protein
VRTLIKARLASFHGRVSLKRQPKIRRILAVPLSKRSCGPAMYCLRWRTFRCAAIALSIISAQATTAHCQSSALPQFSNPYGGASAYVGSPAPAQTVKKRKAKNARLKASKGADAWKFADKPSTTPTGRRVAFPTAPGEPKNDSPIGFSLRWSAENDPYENAGSSTIPAIDQLRRDSNQTPTETGSGVQAGVNLKF